jgi:hypothetical protein
VAAVQGFLAGILFVTDVMMAAVFAMFFATDAVWQWLSAKRSGGALMVGGLAAATTVAAVFLIGALPREGGNVAFKLHSMAPIAPIYLIVELGPLALLGGLGLVLVFRRRAQLADQGMWLRLLAISLVTAFLLFVPLASNHVIRKSIKILQIPLVVLTAPALAFVLSKKPPTAVLLVLTLAGGLTMFTDTRHYLLPRPDAVSYIAAEQIQAARWIRDCTAPETVVHDIAQPRPADRFFDTFLSVIASIGERRSPWGDTYHMYLFRAGDTAIAERRAVLDDIAVATDGSTLASLLSQIPVDLLYVDPGRPGPHAAIEQLVATGSLRRVKCIGAVCLFRFAGRGPALVCSDSGNGQ